jgi:deoxyribodipyrimidine photo-lyase
MMVDPLLDVKSTAMVWLRNDLRVSDHKSFSLATKSGLRVIAYYSFDPNQFKTTPWGFKKTESHRAQFLIETLSELKQSLMGLNISLIIDTIDPVTGIANLVKTLNIKEIYFQKEWTQEERVVEEKLRTKLNEKVNFHSNFDQFLFHPDDVPFELNDLPEVFTRFRKQCEKNMQCQRTLNRNNTIKQRKFIRTELFNSISN